MRADVPLPDGRTITFDDAIPRTWQSSAPPEPPARLVFAAAHVVLKPGYRAVRHSLARPGTPEEIAEHLDLDATMVLRRHLDAHGLGVAEAMDTAQRFFLGWTNAERLIAACGALRLRHGFVAGAGVDHLAVVRGPTDLVDGVVHQIGVIERAGGLPIILPLPWLAQNQAPAQTYVDVYGAIFAQCRGPLFVHWLGPMFAPALAGYFPGDSFTRVMALAPAVVRGCKLSLLDAALEMRVRRELLARDQIVLTGDDWHFDTLLAGEDPAIVRRTRIGRHDVALGAFSHALLGVLSGIARPAQAGLCALARGDHALFATIMRPCARFGEVVFTPPTQHYKVGLAFTAWLNGLQSDFMLVNHEETARDGEHLLRVAAAAAACGAITDATTAAARLRAFLGGGQ
jgi:hypothetical protein